MPPIYLLSTKWVDYVEEPMKYQALRPQFFSGWVSGGGMGGGGEGGGGSVGSGGVRVSRGGGGRWVVVGWVVVVLGG